MIERSASVWRRRGF